MAIPVYVVICGMRDMLLLYVDNLDLVDVRF